MGIQIGMQCSKIWTNKAESYILRLYDRKVICYHDFTRVLRNSTKPQIGIHGWIESELAGMDRWRPIHLAIGTNRICEESHVDFQLNSFFYSLHVYRQFLSLPCGFSIQGKCLSCLYLYLLTYVFLNCILDWSLYIWVLGILQCIQSHSVLSETTNDLVSSSFYFLRQWSWNLKLYCEWIKYIQCIKDRPCKSI